MTRYTYSAYSCHGLNGDVLVIQTYGDGEIVVDLLLMDPAITVATMLENAGWADLGAGGLVTPLEVTAHIKLEEDDVIVLTATYVDPVTAYREERGTIANYQMGGGDPEPVLWDNGWALNSTWTPSENQSLEIKLVRTGLRDAGLA